jgi:DNA-binding NtrC family response regulator
MSPGLQVKLLRVIQQMTFEPLGGMGSIKVDVRVVAATNQDLKQGMKDGRFREDLYYRLNVIPIHLPSLQERREDIPLLVDHFLHIYSQKYDKPLTQLTREVLDRLIGYSWPGNVRELENCIERAVVMSPKGMFSMDLLPDEILESKRSLSSHSPRTPEDREHFRQTLQNLCDSTGTSELGELLDYLTKEIEKTVLSKAIASGRSQRDLAKILDMSRMTLRKRLAEHNID